MRYASGDMVGKFGIERYLDASLRGTNGAENVVVNVVGRKSGSWGGSRLSQGAMSC